jgi:hypothetical protein
MQAIKDAQAIPSVMPLLLYNKIIGIARYNKDHKTRNGNTILNLLKTRFRWYTATPAKSEDTIFAANPTCISGGHKFLAMAKGNMSRLGRGFHTNPMAAR